MKVAVGIKALNEEAHIAAAIESARAALARVGGGQIILADSGSSDATVAIAQRYREVRIVQLSDPALRSCGTGAQLAFQSVEADYFYLLDGDMVLDADFLCEGIAFLEAHRDHAAVGGRVREVNTASIEFELRARNDRIKGSAVAGEVDRLDCGGLYRVAAVRAVGHFADSNLHAFEEFELGARLRAVGWKLARIDAPGVDHHGHATGGYRLMLRRLRSGYAGGPGEVIRAAWGRPHFPLVLRDFAQLRYSIAVIGWWVTLAALLVSGLWVAAVGIALLPLGFLVWRRASLRLGLYSLATWNMIALGFLQGLVRRRRAPDVPLPARDISRAGD
ncbi:glycosyltransferase [Sphingomonas sp. R647]|uniref:glycosyltransferase n=1 Tax=Sphingomonas sp. R647 TaxID=2875233 RepID=UPI001CD58EA3|nr:glycosyltransferase [Sphingomonas sp. R647]MCA1196342.1 glycosyltransferase [Sphingomonas sp. R647]